jgi:putative ABC transport system substrate-binding protein
VRRRLLIALAAGASAWPAAAQARPRIVLLHSGFPVRTPIHLLFEALQGHGYENGRTAAIALLGAEGDPDRLTTLVSGIIAQPPDVIIALTSPAVLALKRAAVTTPIVFVFVSDPVGLGIVASLARPGANITGVTYSEAVLGAKRLELLADALPGLRRVAILWGRGFLDNVALLEAARRAAQTRGLELFTREIADAADLTAAFGDATRSGAQAVLFMGDNTLNAWRKEVAPLALAHRLPSIHSFSIEVEDGGLMSFGPELGDNYRRAAALADRVLKGASPADLPVEEPTHFTFVVKLKTAAALGLTLPPSILLRADRGIE